MAMQFSWNKEKAAVPAPLDRQALLAAIGTGATDEELDMVARLLQPQNANLRNKALAEVRKRLK